MNSELIDRIFGENINDHASGVIDIPLHRRIDPITEGNHVLYKFYAELYAMEGLMNQVVINAMGGIWR